MQDDLNKTGLGNMKITDYDDYIQVPSVFPQQYETSRIVCQDNADQSRQGITLYQGNTLRHKKTKHIEESQDNNYSKVLVLSSYDTVSQTTKQIHQTQHIIYQIHPYIQQINKRYYAYEDIQEDIQEDTYQHYVTPIDYMRAQMENSTQESQEEQKVDEDSDMPQNYSNIMALYADYYATDIVQQFCQNQLFYIYVDETVAQQQRAAIQSFVQASRHIFIHVDFNMNVEAIYNQDKSIKRYLTVLFYLEYTNCSSNVYIIDPYRNRVMIYDKYMQQQKDQDLLIKHYLQLDIQQDISRFELRFDDEYHSYIKFLEISSQWQVLDLKLFDFESYFQPLYTRYYCACCELTILCLCQQYDLYCMHYQIFQQTFQNQVQDLARQVSQTNKITVMIRNQRITGNSDQEKNWHDHMLVNKEVINVFRDIALTLTHQSNCTILQQLTIENKFQTSYIPLLQNDTSTRLAFVALNSFKDTNADFDSSLMQETLYYPILQCKSLSSNIQFDQKYESILSIKHVNLSDQRDQYFFTAVSQAVITAVKKIGNINYYPEDMQIAYMYYIACIVFQLKDVRRVFQDNNQMNAQAVDAIIDTFAIDVFVNIFFNGLLCQSNVALIPFDENDIYAEDILYYPNQRDQYIQTIKIFFVRGIGKYTYGMKTYMTFDIDNALLNKQQQQQQFALCDIMQSESQGCNTIYLQCNVLDKCVQFPVHMCKYDNFTILKITSVQQLEHLVLHLQQNAYEQYMLQYLQTYQHIFPNMGFQNAGFKQHDNVKTNCPKLDMSQYCTEIKDFKDKIYVKDVNSLLQYAISWIVFQKQGGILVLVLHYLQKMDLYIRLFNKLQQIFFMLTEQLRQHIQNTLQIFCYATDVIRYCNQLQQYEKSTIFILSYDEFYDLNSNMLTKNKTYTQELIEVYDAEIIMRDKYYYMEYYMYHIQQIDAHDIDFQDQEQDAICCWTQSTETKEILSKDQYQKTVNEFLQLLQSITAIQYANSFLNQTDLASCPVYIQKIYNMQYFEDVILNSKQYYQYYDESFPCMHLIPCVKYAPQIGYFYDLVSFMLIHFMVVFKYLSQMYLFQMRDLACYLLGDHVLETQLYQKTFYEYREQYFQKVLNHFITNMKKCSSETLQVFSNTCDAEDIRVKHISKESYDQYFYKTNSTVLQEIQKYAQSYIGSVSILPESSSHSKDTSTSYKSPVNVNSYKIPTDIKSNEKQDSVQNQTVIPSYITQKIDQQQYTYQIDQFTAQGDQQSGSMTVFKTSLQHCQTPIEYKHTQTAFQIKTKYKIAFTRTRDIIQAIEQCKSGIVIDLGNIDGLGRQKAVNFWYISKKEVVFFDHYHQSLRIIGRKTVEDNNEIYYNDTDVKRQIQYFLFDCFYFPKIKFKQNITVITRQQCIETPYFSQGIDYLLRTYKIDNSIDASDTINIDIVFIQQEQNTKINIYRNFYSGGMQQPQNIPKIVAHNFYAQKLQYLLRLLRHLKLAPEDKKYRTIYGDIDKIKMVTTSENKLQEDQIQKTQRFLQGNTIIYKQKTEQQYRVKNNKYQFVQVIKQIDLGYFKQYLNYDKQIKDISQ